MASFFQEDLHSSDSEDEDYVPDPKEISSSDDENPLPDNEIKTKKHVKSDGVHDLKDAEHKTSDESAIKVPKVDEKQRANDLYKSFLEEVEAEMKERESKYESPVLSSDSGVKSKDISPEESKCELYDFAGETVSVSVKDGIKIASTEKAAASVEGEVVKCETNMSEKPTDQPPVTKRKGLQFVLNTIMNKKQKLSTLQKTEIDWRTFKNEQGISEDLKKYNLGRGGFIERQRFLERSDVRSYEIERDIRMSKGKKKE